MSLPRIKGEPGAIASYARKMHDYSDELMDAAKALRRVANADMTISTAVDAVRGDALAAADETGKVVVRYVGTADALAKYAVRLEPVQTEGNAAATAWDVARVDIATWTGKRDDEAARYALAPEGSAEQEEALIAAKAAQKELEAAEQRCVDAKTRYDQAIQDYNAAAAEAVQGINAAQEASQLNDGFWDEMRGIQSNIAGVFEALAPALEWLKHWCDEIAQALSFIAMICAFIPGLQELGALLETIALVLSTISLLCSVALFIGGQGTLGDLFESAVTVTVGVLTHGTIKTGGVLGKATSHLPDGVVSKVDKALDLLNEGPHPLEHGLEMLGGSHPVVANVLDKGTHLITGSNDGLSLVDSHADVTSLGDIIDKVPFSDFKIPNGLESLDSPGWSRPPDLEIPTFDLQDYSVPDVAQTCFTGAQDAFGAGELRIQATAGLCR